MFEYKIKRVRRFDLLSMCCVSRILMDCGRDMAEKYNLHHWHNGMLKTFLIVCYTSLKNEIWLVENNEKRALATFQVRVTPRGFHFSKLATSPQAAGKGIGSLCMSEIETMAKDRGCNVVYMEVYDKSKHAIDFYVHRGYKQCGETKSLKYREFIFQKSIE